MVFIIVCVVFQPFVLLISHDHFFVFVVTVEVTDFVHAKHAWIDVVTCTCDLDVDFVVGEDAHAVDLSSVYGFSELGETSIFVEHVGGGVEANILRED